MDLPLYAVVLADELRLFGVFELVTKMITDLPDQVQANHMLPSEQISLCKV